MFFRFPPDSHSNPERSVVGFGIDVGGMEGSFACYGACSKTYSRRLLHRNDRWKPAMFTGPGENSSLSRRFAVSS